MSIWCSNEQIGHDIPFFDDQPNGEVRTYAEGFSNHYPNTDGTHEMPAAIGLSHIPQWCVPGYKRADESYEEVGEWVRLEVAGTGKNFWTKPETEEAVNACVVLDETAATMLRDQLTAWLERPKLHALEANE